MRGWGIERLGERGGCIYFGGRWQGKKKKVFLFHRRNIYRQDGRLADWIELLALLALHAGQGGLFGVIIELGKAFFHAQMLL